MKLMEKQETKHEQENKEAMDEEQLDKVSGGGIQITPLNSVDAPEGTIKMTPKEFPKHWS